MVEVFKTNVKSKLAAKDLVAELLKEFPFQDVHFDLADKDRILRIEACEIQPEKVITLLSNSGFRCEILQD